MIIEIQINKQKVLKLLYRKCCYVMHISKFKILESFVLFIVYESDPRYQSDPKSGHV